MEDHACLKEFQELAITTQVVLGNAAWEVLEKMREEVNDPLFEVVMKAVGIKHWDIKEKAVEVKQVEKVIMGLLP